MHSAKNGRGLVMKNPKEDKLETWIEGAKSLSPATCLRTKQMGDGTWANSINHHMAERQRAASCA
jgi:hypothetical protein